MSADIEKAQLIINQLKHDSTQVRVNAAKQLRTLALALGPDRSRNELLPFLKECLDDEDEVLETFAEELSPSFVDTLGGNAHAYTLLDIFEVLSGVEQSKVRNKAVESLNSIASLFPDEHIETYYFPFIEKLCNADWFTSHIAASGLIGHIYPKVSNEKKDRLREFYFGILRNDSPLVRRGASANLNKLISVVEDEYVMSEMLEAFMMTFQDDQDAVRFMSVDSCVALGSRITKLEQITEHILPVVRSLSSDKAWRVRYMVADRFCSLAKLFQGEILENEIVKMYTSLLRDQEAEVRSAAAAHITALSSLLNEAVIINEILPHVTGVANDPDEHVRSSLASDVMGLAPLLGKSKTLEHLSGLFLKFLQDEFFEVRLSVISKLEGINKVIGIELLSDSLVPAIRNLAEDKQWRVRFAIIKLIPLLGRQLGVEFFDAKLSELCLKWLGDSVFDIRKAAAENIKELVDVFGLEWAVGGILPQVFEFCNHSNHQYRMTTLLTVSAVVSSLSPTLLERTVLPLVIQLTSDPVPNIRFNAVNTLQLCGSFLERSVVETKIGPVFQERAASDIDVDVKSFAIKAIQDLSL